MHSGPTNAALDTTIGRVARAAACMAPVAAKGARRPKTHSLVGMSPTQCLHWCGSAKPRTDASTRRRDVARHVYTLFVGDVESGDVVERVCATDGCVQPSHLRCVDAARSERRARVERMLDTHAAALHTCIAHRWPASMRITLARAVVAEARTLGVADVDARLADEVPRDDLPRVAWRAGDADGERRTVARACDNPDCPCDALVVAAAPADARARAAPLPWMTPPSANAE